MALTFKISDIPSGMYPEKDLVYAPALRAPVDVKFRLGADLVKVATQVLASVHVRLVAAVGSGKSSKMPVALALKSAGLVVYVTANRLLARSAFAYAVKRSVDDSTFPPLHVALKGDAVEMPRTGVMYCGADEYVALLLRAHRGGKELSPHVVFLDEAHKCDAWTYVTKKLCLSLGATHLVEASATFDPDSNVMRETPGTVVEHGGLDPSVASWRSSDKAKPWSVVSVTNNVVVFTDSRTEATHILDEYKMCGFDVFRLYANMPDVEFELAMRHLNDKKGPLVALVADSSFRDGFAFDASLCLDSGRVGYYKYVMGGVVRSYRELYRLERIQTAGRFARLGNGTAHYHYPDVAYPKMVCDLAPVEMEVVAYVYRLLGFKPGVEFAGAIMAEAVLPEQYEFSTVINAVYPLQHYAVDGSGRSRTPPPAYAGEASGHVRAEESVKPGYTSGQSLSSASRSGSLGDESDVSSTLPSSRASLSDAALDSASGAPDFSELYSAIKKGQPDVTAVVEGQYCHVSTLGDVDVSQTRFPRGLGSLDEYMSPGLSMTELYRVVARHSAAFRDEALDMVVARYNTINAYMRAMSSVLSEWRELDASKGVGPRFWAEMELLAEQYTSMSAERGLMLARLKALADGHHEVMVINSPVQAERDYASVLRDRLQRSASVTRRDEGALVDRLNCDLKFAGPRGDVRRRSVKGSVSVEFSDRCNVEKYSLPFWSGCKQVEEWYNPDGSVRKSKHELNALGRLLTGKREVTVSQRRISVVDKRGLTQSRSRRSSGCSYGSGDSRVEEVG